MLVLNKLLPLKIHSIVNLTIEYTDRYSTHWNRQASTQLFSPVQALVDTPPAVSSVYYTDLRNPVIPVEVADAAGVN